jgi:hypothetical protein
MGVEAAEAGQGECETQRETSVVSVPMLLF